MAVVTCPFVRPRGQLEVSRHPQAATSTQTVLADAGFSRVPLQEDVHKNLVRQFNELAERPAKRLNRDLCYQTYANDPA